MTATPWHIDPAHSGIHFSVRHMVVAKVRGRFGAWRGAVTFDGPDLTKARAEVEIDATSIDTGVGDRDNHLRSPDFLDAEHYPTLKFASRKVEKAEGGYRITGDLTIRDVTNEVVLEVADGGRVKDPWGKQRAVFAGTTSFKRSDFGLTWNQALETGGVVVGDRIDVELEIEAVEAEAAEAA